jgi:16S rRNA U516 pseudouridylate synthase RsuA-like enzyme
MANPNHFCSMNARSFQLVHSKFERIAKRIAMSGMMSRKEAEMCLKDGEVYVDGRKTTANMVVPDEAKLVVSRFNSL